MDVSMIVHCACAAHCSTAYHSRVAYPSSTEVLLPYTSTTKVVPQGTLRYSTLLSFFSRSTVYTIQHKYFEGYKFRCFPTKCKNYFHKNEQTPIVTWLNYACDLWNLFFVISKSTKYIAHEIFVLYSSWYWTSLQGVLARGQDSQPHPRSKGVKLHGIASRRK